MYFSLCALHVVLSMGTTEKGLVLSSVLPSFIHMNKILPEPSLLKAEQP